VKAETLPGEWKLETLEDVSLAIQYGYTAKAELEPVGPRLLRITDIQNDSVTWDEVPFCRIKKEEIQKYLLAPNDILFARTGATVGKSYLIHGLVPESVFASYLLRVRFKPGVTPKYVSYFFKSPSYWRQITESQVGIGQPNVNGTKLAQIRIPVAPLEQQKRIVAEIEKQFSRLDEAVASLKRTKANLKRYKAAILKAAVEGKLTEDWRKQHPNVEPASKLLERILLERRGKWNGKGKYSEPEQPDITSLPKLPDGWIWACLEAIAALKGGITVDKNRKSFNARKIPYLRVANVQRGYLDLSEIKEIDAPEADIRDLRLVPGDILFNEGGDRDKLGRGWVWEGQLSECIHQNHVFRARLYLADVSPKLVSWWGNSFGKNYFLREGKQTTNLASINITKLSAFPIPLPSAAEQQQIINEVECRLSVIDELEATVEANLTHADSLRQSVLGTAFRGKLNIKERNAK
jgi:type I restriction enzyme S subunit